MNRKYFTFCSCVTFACSRYFQNDDEFEQPGGYFVGFEGEPSLGASLELTFLDNFSDVNSEDMRRPVPDWINDAEMEEDFEP